MDRSSFRKLLDSQWGKGKFVCVGLDPHWDSIPEAAYQRRGRGEVKILETIIAFIKVIVDATCDIALAYKPNSAFYEMYPDGFRALRSIIEHIHKVAPHAPVIYDGKRGDIGNTNTGYGKAAFDLFGADAITVSPYLGAESLSPLLERHDKGIFVLCRTSNIGAGEFQNLTVEGGTPLYQVVARNVAQDWNKRGNCGLVVGATCPEEIGQVRQIVGDMPLLIPGIGAQGGDLEKTVLAGVNSQNNGVIINSSRGIIHASKGPDFADAAHRETEYLNCLINKHLKA